MLLMTVPQPETPFIEFRHNLKFEFSGIAPIGDVAASLLAMERMLKRSGPFVKAVAGVLPSRVEVHLEGLKSGSLHEDFAVRFFFRDKRRMNKFIDNLADSSGIRKVMASKYIVPVFLACMAAGGGFIAYKWVTGEKPPANIVNIRDNTIITIGAEQLKISPEQMVELVMSTVNRTRAAQDAMHFVKPARVGKGGDVVFDGAEGGRLAKSTIDLVPDEAKPPVGEIVEEVDDVEIEIRALDLDNTEKWAAVVRSQGGARHPLSISPGIDVAALRNRSVIRGDILVHARTKQGKKGLVREITRYELLSVEDGAE